MSPTPEDVDRINAARAIRHVATNGKRRPGTKAALLAVADTLDVENLAEDIGTRDLDGLRAVLNSDWFARTIDASIADARADERERVATALEAAMLPGGWVDMNRPGLAEAIRITQALT